MVTIERVVETGNELKVTIYDMMEWCIGGGFKSRITKAKLLHLHGKLGRLDVFLFTYKIGERGACLGRISMNSFVSYIFFFSRIRICKLSSKSAVKQLTHWQYY